MSILSNNLFQRWQDPTEDEPIKIGDKVRFLRRPGLGEKIMMEGDVEFKGHKSFGVRVTKYDHWAYDIGEIVTVSGIRGPMIEVYR